MKLLTCVILLSCSSCSLLKKPSSETPILSPIDSMIETQMQSISQQISQ